VGLMKTLKKIRSRMKRGMPVTEEEQWLYYQETGQTKSYSPPPVKGSVVETKKTYVYKECHSGNVKVFDIGNLTVYGGGTSHGVKPYQDWVVIDLVRAYRPDIYVNAKGFEAFKTKIPNEGPVIEIDWPDMGVPKLTGEMWEALAGDLRKIAKKETKTSVVVCCMGGHGRTGTCLSILAALLLDKKEPIKFVREVYCKKAVESKSQVEYVGKMTGLKLEDDPYKGYTAYKGTNLPAVVGGTGVWTYVGGEWFKNGVPERLIPIAEGGKMKEAVGEGKKEVEKPVITGVETFDAGWEAVTCCMCYGPKIDGVCRGCNRIEALCDCPL
jgi:protein-tyrosine phosphatase